MRGMNSSQSNISRSTVLKNFESNSRIQDSKNSGQKMKKLNLSIGIRIRYQEYHY